MTIRENACKLKRLYQLLTPEKRKKLLGLQVVVIIMDFAEVAGAAAIAPFMALVGDISRLEGEGTLGQLYQASGMETPTVSG